MFSINKLVLAQLWVFLLVLGATYMFLQYICVSVLFMKKTMLTVRCGATLYLFAQY